LLGRDDLDHDVGGRDDVVLEAPIGRTGQPGPPEDHHVGHHGATGEGRPQLRERHGDPVRCASSVELLGDHELQTAVLRLGRYLLRHRSFRELERRLLLGQPEELLERQARRAIAI
jgi:hypothetical protein